MEGKCEEQPWLNGEKKEPKYSHGFCSAEIQTLASVAEVFFPSLPPDSGFQRKETQPSKAVQSFLKASASQPAFPEEVAELLGKRAFIESVIVVRIVLVLLWTRVGSLLLCGRQCLGKEWPFINDFGSMGLEKREKVMQNWLKHGFLFTPTRVAFIYLKVFCLFVYFSRVGEDGYNPAWEAIGYNVDKVEDQPQARKERPLQKGMIETVHEKDSTLYRSLSQKGLLVTEDTQQNVYRIKCDAVVIGSGCGGGVAAAMLAGSGLKVVVVEKGNYFTSTDYSPFEGPSMDKLYESGGILPSLDGQLLILAGSTVGGGSAVNWSACIKTPKYVLKEWAEDWCKAERFILERNKVSSARKMKCLGVSAKPSNQNITKELHIEAKVTISACGALLTPLLMHSSGLKNRNIGQNLHLHPVLMAWGYFPDSDSKFKGKAYEGGIITSVHKVAGNDNKVQAIIETPSLGPAQYSAVCPWVSGLDMKARMLKFSRTAHMITIIRDQGSGKVHAGGRVTYKFEEVDRQNLRAGLRQSLRILVAAGAVEVGTHRSDGQRIRCKGISNEEFEEFLDSVSMLTSPLCTGENWVVHTSAHQMGSCRMGINEEEGAVDENGESWEAEGLFVCDASVLPSAVGVNPMITVQSTAYCLSKKIAESLRQQK
ncbi:hypothetical protein GOBAR_DD03286 [Gossypium barbadense]|nr:hypothetical protein GOBAR_DD03286 [Gossypium barbadense]